MLLGAAGDRVATRRAHAARGRGGVRRPRRIITHALDGAGTNLALKPWEGRVSWPATCNPGYSDKARDELVKTAHSSCPRECFEATHPVHRHGCKTCMHHPRGGSCARCNSLGFDCHCTCSMEPLHPSRVPMHRHLPFVAQQKNREKNRGKTRETWRQPSQ